MWCGIIEYKYAIRKEHDVTRGEYFEFNTLVTR